MEAVLNFAGVVEIEFAGAVELGSYILYSVNNVCSWLLLNSEMIGNSGVARVG
ncbi:unnamed protein product [Brassica oleracea]